MNHPEIYNDVLQFNVADPYELFAYGRILDLLLGSENNDPSLPGRVKELEEQHRHMLGPRRSMIITSQAVLDEADIRNPRLELLGWHS